MSLKRQSATQPTIAEAQAADSLARAIRIAVTCEPGCPDCPTLLRTAIDAFEQVRTTGQTPGQRH